MNDQSSKNGVARWKMYAAWIGVAIALLGLLATLVNSWAVLPWRVTHLEVDVGSLREAQRDNRELLIEMRTDLRYVREQIEKDLR